MRTLAPTPTRALAPVRSRLAGTAARLGYAVWFPLAVYALTRLIGAVLILVAARYQVALPGGVSELPGYEVGQGSPASPGYSSIATNWDGQWYLRIATQGYPSTIPRDAGGVAIQNQWGFYPAYPLLVGALMRLTGLSFMVVAPTLSLLLGAAAVVVMFRLVNLSSGRFAASATVLLVCTYMAAPVMQIAYTESLALLIVCTALLLLRNRRYGWLVPVLITLALTRAIVLAFVPVLLVHGILRYRRRSVDPFPSPERWRVFGLAGLGVGVTGLWPLIAAVTTGDPAAYPETMSSWGTTGELRVLIEFPAFAWEQGGAGAVGVLVLIIALTAALLLRRGARAWDPEVHAWAGFYPLFLLLATAPGTSNVRHLLLAFPLMWPFPEEAASSSERWQRVAMVAVLAACGLAMQWVWVSQFLVVSGPPEGRPYP